MIRIILFGGSFDPIHKGHLEIASAALKQRNADALWFIPTQMSPFKENSTDYHHRFRMIELAVRGKSRMYVSDVEAHLPSPSYTIDTVKALKDKYPHYHFEWLIGSDQLERLNEWKAIDQLRELITFIVYNRSKEALVTDMPIIKGEFLDISSTDIRLGKSTQTPHEVLSYMTRNSLYLKQYLKKRLSQSRYDHILRVLDLAESLALYHGHDIAAVRLAALAHDLCKEDSDADLKQLMLKVYPKYASLHPKIYHAYAAAHEMSKRYYIKDKRILDAIRAHVVGSATHPIAMILFIADKCEAGRNYDSSRLVDLAFQDLTKGFKAVKASSDSFRLRKGN